MQHFEPVASVIPVWRSSSLQRTSTNALPVTGSHVNGAHEHSVPSPSGHPRSAQQNPPFVEAVLHSVSSPAPPALQMQPCFPRSPQSELKRGAASGLDAPSALPAPPSVVEQTGHEDAMQEASADETAEIVPQLEPVAHRSSTSRLCVQASLAQHSLTGCWQLFAMH